MHFIQASFVEPLHRHVEILQTAYHTSGFFGAEGAFGADGALGGKAWGVPGAVADEPIGALGGASFNSIPSIFCWQNGHFLGVCPAVRFIFFPQNGHSTGPTSNSTGLKHIRHPSMIEVTDRLTDSNMDSKKAPVIK